MSITIERVDPRSSPLAPAAAPGSTARLSPVLCWGFYLFILSIPFEMMDIGTKSLSLSKIAGYAFFLIGFTQARVCFRPPPRAFWLFVAYIAICAVLGLQDWDHRDEFIIQTFSFVQMLVLFWIAYN